MHARKLLTLALAGLAATALCLTACGGDDDSTPDAAGAADAGDTPDAVATPDAAPPSACLSPLDLDTVGTVMGNEVSFAGTIADGFDTITPAASCTTFATSHEQVLSYTVASRSRVTASTLTDTSMLDTVLTIRTDCENGADLACNDDINAQGGVLQSRVVVDDVPAGTVLYFIIDSVVPANLPQPFTLRVTLAPINTAGQPCDPAGVNSLCEAGLVCSIATGAPVCATPLGGPTLSNVLVVVRDNQTSTRVTFDAADPDGDVQTLLGMVLDGMGQPIDFNNDGLPDELALATAAPLFGQLTQSAEALLRSNDPTWTAFRLRLVDSGGATSATIDAPIVRPSYAQCRSVYECSRR